ncbi:MAG TPA: hypothetical protein ENO31_04590 [Thermoprotei archaeon]|nr:hypothetical protein [TACK group archaeon]HEV51785.1 hypothetical protein [Thermoprotei archaeon]
MNSASDLIGEAKKELEEIRRLVIETEQAGEINEDDLVEIGVRITESINRAEKALESAQKLLATRRDAGEGS